MHIANTFRSANRKTHSKRCTWRAPVAVPLTRSPDPPLARSHDAPKAARCAHRLPFQAPAPPALAHPIQRPSAPLRVAHNSHYPMEHACQRESCEYDTFTQDALRRRAQGTGQIQPCHAVAARLTRFGGLPILCTSTTTLLSPQRTQSARRTALYFHEVHEGHEEGNIRLSAVPACLCVSFVGNSGCSLWFRWSQ